MSVTSLYPVLMSASVATTSAFYKEILGFETEFEADWYVSLRLGAFELAILAYDHPTVPEPYRALPQGVIVNIEVEDAEAMYRQLSQLDVTVLLPLKDEDFGQRHFILEGPDAVMIDIIQPIPPSEEFVQAYSDGS